jgi:hypothetical protein
VAQEVACFGQLQTITCTCCSRGMTLAELQLPICSCTNTADPQLHRSGTYTQGDGDMRCDNIIHDAHTFCRPQLLAGTLCIATSSWRTCCLHHQMTSQRQALQVSVYTAHTACQVHVAGSRFAGLQEHQLWKVQCRPCVVAAYGAELLAKQKMWCRSAGSSWS